MQNAHAKFNSPMRRTPKTKQKKGKVLISDIVDRRSRMVKKKQNKTGSARKQCQRIKKKYTICSLSPQRLLRRHYIMQNGHSEPYDIAVIESRTPISLCAWSEVLCRFNELFRLVAGCFWAVTTSSVNNCYCLLKARCMEFMQIKSKGKKKCVCVCVCVCEGVLE